MILQLVTNRLKDSLQGHVTCRYDFLFVSHFPLQNLICVIAGERTHDWNVRKGSERIYLCRGYKPLSKQYEYIWRGIRIVASLMPT